MGWTSGGAVGAPADRKGETVIERSLRDQGFDVFMPSTVREVRHHRTDEFIVKRFPLMVGYAFVRDPHSFYTLLDCDGVWVARCASRPQTSRTSAPPRRREAMERRRARRIEKETQAGRKLTRKEARDVFPKNHRVVVNGGFLKGMGGYVVDATGRNTIKVMIETLIPLRNAGDFA